MPLENCGNNRIVYLFDGNLNNFIINRLFINFIFQFKQYFKVNGKPVEIN